MPGSGRSGVRSGGTAQRRSAPSSSSPLPSWLLVPKPHSQASPASSKQPETARPAAAPTTLTPASPSTCLGSGQAGQQARDRGTGEVSKEHAQPHSARSAVCRLRHSVVPPLASPASADTFASFCPSRPYVGRPKDSNVPARASGRARYSPNAPDSNTGDALPTVLTAPCPPPPAPTCVREHQRVVLPAADQHRALALKGLD